MSNKKHRRSEDDESDHASAPPAKKSTAQMIEVNGELRQETHKEQLRREKKEKKQVKKAEKKEKKERSSKTDPSPKSEKKDHKKSAAKAAKKAQKEAEEKAAAEAEEQRKAAKKAKKDADKDAESESESSSESESEVEAEVAKKHTKKAETTTETTAYKQTAALTAVPAADIEAFLKKEQVAIHDPRAGKTGSTETLRPIVEFSHLPKTQLIQKKPFAAYKTPTPIQSASWPFSLAGRDLVGIAETGSGKTIAFAVPCVEALLRVPRPAAIEATHKLPVRSRLHYKSDGGHAGHVAQPRAVIVSPTRELAMQTHAAMAPLAALVGLTAVCLFGGASKDDQRALLRQRSGVDIIVATPGRLKDFLNDQEISLAHVCFAVLDEADRMLDTGFEEDIRHILGQCPAREQRQTLMFTATWPTSVRGLADGFMIDPVKITVGSKTRAGMGVDGADGVGAGGGSTELQANARITQTVEVLDQHAKERRLLQIVKQEQRGKAKNDRILVFCLYKKEAVRVENFLQGQGVRVCSIHGNLRQDQRTRSLEAFKSGQTPVLVATDVAARGLDIPEVKLVINVTFPLTIEDYVHRIGRTGRAGKDGRAITFFTEHDKTHSGSLVNILKGANQEVPDDLLKFGTTVKKKAHGTYGAFFKDVDMSQKGTKITFD